MSNTVRTKTDYTTNPPSQGHPTTGRVQRLLRKPTSEWQARISQAFGGAALQMSEAGWKVCQEVFDFDYMGAAEYEFGAIPAALKNIVNQRADYRVWSFTIKGSEVKPGWWRQRAMDVYRRAEIANAKRLGMKPPRMTPKHKKELADKAGAPIPDSTIYVVSHKDQDVQVVETLIRLIGDDKVRPKNGALFDLDPEPRSYGRDVIGWFDLDNEILWFSDREVSEGFKTLFEIGEQNRRSA